MKKIASKSFNCILLIVITFAYLTSTLYSQDSTFRSKAWRYGINLGIQSNQAALGWQELYGGIYSFQSAQNDINYVDGNGLGLYAGVFATYLSESWWGVQMQVSYDTRDALIVDITKTPHSSFDTKVRYLTFEPLFRVDQKLIPNLNFYAGPFLAVNLNASFQYKLDQDQATADKDFNVINFNSIAYGVQAGMAYDIRVMDISEYKSIIASPFFDVSWLVNQKKSIYQDGQQDAISDVWSTASFRLGLKVAMEDIVPSENQRVTIILPEDNEVVSRVVTGYFPLHPYIFFDKGDPEIPVRYTKLTPDQAMKFKESDMENFEDGDLTVKETNINQLMKTYYNSLNIFADRMRTNPSEKLSLRVSNPENNEISNSGNNVKNYLVNNFGISPDRITVEYEAPVNPSGSVNTEEVSKGLIADENRRVKFVFSNPNMARPIKYSIRDEFSIDNDMIFAINSNTPFKSWDLMISGEGKILTYGPFESNSTRINPGDMMKSLNDGRYTATTTITDINGKIFVESHTFKLSKIKDVKNASRFLMVFNYNDDNAVKSYKDKILNEIVPQIEDGDEVIIHGHTDVIGTVAGNNALSQKRADVAKEIIDTELTSAKKLVEIKSIGLGQTVTPYTFSNKNPEGRMYNRNVFVEVVK